MENFDKSKISITVFSHSLVNSNAGTEVRYLGRGAYNRYDYLEEIAIKH